MSNKIEEMIYKFEFIKRSHSINIAYQDGFLVYADEDYFLKKPAEFYMKFQKGGLLCKRFFI